MSQDELSRCDSTRRFSDRVDNYIRYRPGYPAEVMRLLREELGLTADAVVADVGSGTGIFAEQLLNQGWRVIGVEPNAEMRMAGERLLAGHARFTSVDGTAENTTLSDHSVDLITAAQAFHWFDAARAREEFRRILRPGGYVALIWNERRLDSTPFLQDYERLLLEYGTDYKQVGAHHVKPGMIETLFSSGGWMERSFVNAQEFDFEGLAGRALSSSYMPTEAHPRYASMMAELRRVFDRHQVDERVRFDYDTRVYYGRLE